MIQAREKPRLAILAPLPLLTVTIEPTPAGRPEIHVHPGGQGTWAARMACVLGADVQLCCALGGESGQVLHELIARWGPQVRAVDMQSAWNPTYVHDRRSGQREVIAEEPEPQTNRHALDDLYTATLDAGMHASVVLLTGTRDRSLIGGEFYRRLTHDLRELNARVVVDLIGEQLNGALASGVDVVKLSIQDLPIMQTPREPTLNELIASMNELHRAGAKNVVLSRGDQPALALADGQPVLARPARLSTLDSTGSGDSQAAAIAVALAAGQPFRDALRLGMAAGAVNAARRGLGSGDAAAIRELATRIKLTEPTLGTPPASTPHASQ